MASHVQGAAIPSHTLIIWLVLQYQAASTVFEFLEGWERAYVSEETGFVMIEGAGFAESRRYTCQFFDKPNVEVSLRPLLTCSGTRGWATACVCCGGGDP